MKRFVIHTSACAPELYPVDTFFGLLWYSPEEALSLPKRYPIAGAWGAALSTQLLEREYYPMPRAVDIVWLAVTEQRFYSLRRALPWQRMEDLWQQTDEMSGKQRFEHIVIGMAPGGGLAVWIRGYKKESLITWMRATATHIDMADFAPTNPTLTLRGLCEDYLLHNPHVKENLEKKGVPSHDLFNNYMKQFTYRYLPLFEKWDEEKEEWKKYENEEGEKTMPDFDYIEEALFDGTHDKLHDGGLMKYHEAGKPKKLAVQWHIKKTEYTAYFWFEDEDICSSFNHFYGAHPDTKTDFMIHIDSEKNKYELALYRYGIGKPRVIPERAYQLLVFKNKFECYRSDNYNQERGAWVW